MADFVRVPETDWQNILDAIREKTGGTEKMLSGEIATAIAGIVSGGGGGDTTQEDGLIARTLTEYSNDSVTQVGQNAFASCGSLSSINLQNVTDVGAYGFRSCVRLLYVHIPKIRSVQVDAFNACSNLEKIDLFNLQQLGARVFAGCTKLKTIVIRSPTVIALPNVNSLSGTPFASGGTGGTVYVPSALIAQYQNATNWSTLYAAGTCNFVAIEGSEYE